MKLGTEHEEETESELELAPIGVVIRGMEIHPAGVGGLLPPFTCIMDGYVVYAFKRKSSDGDSMSGIPGTEHSELGIDSDSGTHKADSVGLDPQSDGVQGQGEPGSPPGSTLPHQRIEAASDGDDDDEDEYAECGGCGCEYECECGECQGDGDMDDGVDVGNAARQPVSSVQEAEGAAPIGNGGVPDAGTRHPTPHAQTHAADRRAEGGDGDGQSLNRGVSQANAYDRNGNGHSHASGRGRGRQQTGMIPPQMEMSIRRKLNELGYKDDDLIIFLVERFHKTALHKLKWLDAYKLQQMLDNGEILAARTEVLN